MQVKLSPSLIIAAADMCRYALSAGEIADEARFSITFDTELEQIDLWDEEATSPQHSCRDTIQFPGIRKLRAEDVNSIPGGEENCVG